MDTLAHTAIFGALATGIIFFQNYWGPGNQGDHIDLWNGARLTALDSWLRIHVRVGSFGLHSLGFGSDLEKSASTWFWAVT
ncbi:MAG TPA: T6SS effector amidase Tae4 family protein [Burkholderiales bacterium]|nr:T6SS effector amidase Tae4 family protein [Burkholderiales bacterium]